MHPDAPLPGPVALSGALLECASANGVRFEGMQPGIPGKMAARLRWHVASPSSVAFRASFSTALDVTPDGLRRALADVLEQFAGTPDASFFAAIDAA